MISIYYILLPPLDLQTALNIDTQNAVQEDLSSKVNLQNEVNKQHDQEVASYNQIIASKESTIEQVADALKEIDQINVNKALEQQIKEEVEKMNYTVQLVEIKNDVIKISVQKQEKDVVIPSIINKINELTQNKYLVEVKIID